MNNPGEITLQIEELELASAALLRGLQSHFDWPAIETRARALAIEAGAQEFPARAASTALMAAARTLDAVAQGAPGGGDVARERGVWAGAAYAAGGNFPSASVVMRRTFPRWRAPDDATAALLCALVPALRGPLRGPLCEPLDTYFAGEAQAAEVWAKWDAIENTVWPDELWLLARAGLEAALECATVRALAEAPQLATQQLATAPQSVAAPSEFAVDSRSNASGSQAPKLGSARLPDGFAARLGAQLPTLLPPQLGAVRAGFLGGANVLAALPPGTGKTLLGELFLSAALGRGPGLAVFLVPYISLGRGVARALRAHFPDAIPIHRWIGGWGGDEKSRAGERPEIAVMTPERFDAMLRARPETWARLRGVVVDEAHTLSAGARGARLEGLIARIRARQNEGAPLRLMLLSAALDERAGLESWAAIEQTVASSWTPTARRLAFWRQDGRLEWHAELAGGATRALGEVESKWPQRIERAAHSWARVRQLEPLTWANVAHLAREFHEARGGAILCLCSTRRATREVARALGELFPIEAQSGGAAARAVEAIEARHRTLLPLARLVERGVAWHNSSLPSEVRGHLESAIESGQIHAVAATSTLAEGVDLPFAQTIVVDWLGWDEGAQKPLSSALFRNIAGRCGRAGAFTEGDTVVFDNPLGPPQWTAPDVRWPVQRRAFVGASLGEPRSAFWRTDDSIAQVNDVVSGTSKAVILAANAVVRANDAVAQVSDADAETSDIVAGANDAFAGASDAVADDEKARAWPETERDAVGATLESQLLALRAQEPQLSFGATARLFYAARQTEDFAARGRRGFGRGLRRRVWSRTAH